MKPRVWQPGIICPLAQAVLEQDAASALAPIDALHRESKDMSRLCEEMAEYFRGLMLIKTMRDRLHAACSPRTSWKG